MFYVYTILDPRKSGTYKYDELEFEYEPIYIGKGKNNRLYHHLKLYNLKKSDSFKNRKLKKILKENLKPIIYKLKENLTEQEAFDLEKEYIAKIGRYPLGPLTNLTDGGDGVSGLKHTPEALDKMSRTWFNKDSVTWNKGIKMSEDHCKKLSESHLGQIIPESTKLAVSRAHKGKKQSEEWVNKKRASMCKKTYKLISPSGEEFVTKNYNQFCREHNLCVGNMSMLLNGKFKQYNGWTGFILEYKYENK